MCGIAGVVDLRGRPVEAEIGRRMARALAHRGPDGEGVWAEGPAAIAHRRLAVIDPEGGAQPFLSDDGRYVLTYNGEVYNFVDLRRDLVARGARFRTRSDVEVVLRAFEAWGPDCVERLWGQFALAVWDARDRRLFLARDRIGKKPVFFTTAAALGGRFFFASEAKAILAVLPEARAIDDQGLFEALYFGNLPPRASCFRGVSQVPPAHAGFLEADGTLDLRRYWRLRPAAKRTDPPEALRDEFRALFEDAVRRRMIADVPLGAFLSGGVDSSVTVATMSRLSTRPVRTFCAVTTGDADDPDIAAARRLAARYGTEHREIPLDPAAPGSRDDFEAMVRAYEAPYNLGSIALLYFNLCREVRRHVTVALNGDGGDEIFAGYLGYRRLRLAAIARRLLPLRLPLPAGAPSSLAGLLLPAEKVQGHLLRRARLGRLEPLLEPDFLGRVDVEAPARLQAAAFAEAGTDDLLDGALVADLTFNHHHTVAAVGDRFGLAHALEVRAPFLDHRLAEFAASLPVSLKVGLRARPKAFLKDSLGGLLPDENLAREKKGFSHETHRLVMAAWRPWIEETLLGDGAARLAGYVRPAAVRALLASWDRERRHDETYLLWSLVTFAVWRRTFGL